MDSEEQEQKKRAEFIEQAISKTAAAWTEMKRSPIESIESLDQDKSILCSTPGCGRERWTLNSRHVGLYCWDCSSRLKIEREQRIVADNEHTDRLRANYRSRLIESQLSDLAHELTNLGFPPDTAKIAEDGWTGWDTSNGLDGKALKNVKSMIVSTDIDISPLRMLICPAAKSRSVNGTGKTLLSAIIAGEFMKRILSADISRLDAAATWSRSVHRVDDHDRLDAWTLLDQLCDKRVVIIDEFSPTSEAAWRYWHTLLDELPDTSIIIIAGYPVDRLERDEYRCRAATPVSSRLSRYTLIEISGRDYRRRS